MMSMKKNNIAQILAPGRVATASGYTWKTSPGPGIRKNTEFFNKLRETASVCYGPDYEILSRVRSALMNLRESNK